MIETETRNLNDIEIKTGERTLQQRWDKVSSSVCSLIDYRFQYGSKERWYIDNYTALKQEFLETPSLERASEINQFPGGILAEVFFMQACNQLGIYCEPTSGDEDVFGVDFKIEDDFETRFLDVSINISSLGLRKKNRDGTFPTLFIPWNVKKNVNGYSPSYAEHYLSTGLFNGKKFFNSILDYNYSNLHNLKKSVWNDARIGEGYMSLNGIQYIKNLEGILGMIRRH